jgi:hypothetical protein
MSEASLQSLMRQLYDLCSPQLPMVCPVGKPQDLVALLARELTQDHRSIVACLKMLGQAGIFAYGFNDSGRLTNISQGPRFGAPLPVPVVRITPPREVVLPNPPHPVREPPYGLTTREYDAFQVLCRYAREDGWSYKPAGALVAWQLGCSPHTAANATGRLRRCGLLRVSQYGYMVSCQAKVALFDQLLCTDGPAGPADWYQHPEAVSALETLRSHASRPPNSSMGWFLGSLTELLEPALNLLVYQLRDVLSLLRLRELYYQPFSRVYWIDFETPVPRSEADLSPALLARNY